MKKEKFLTEGFFELIKIDEGDNYLEFNLPLEINYAVYEEEYLDYETMESPFNFAHPVKKKIITYIQYDFGMEDSFRIDDSGNWLCHGYNGLNKDSNWEDRIKGNVKFDLFHAFYHYTGDPNYTHKHWAIKGWMANRTKINEKRIT